GFAYYFLRAFGSPSVCYQKLVDSAGVYNRIGHFTIEELAESRMTLMYQSAVKEGTKNLCLFRGEQFAAFPIIWGLAPAEIRESECQTTGAAGCRYHLSWKAPIRRRRGKITGGLAGLAAGFISIALMDWPTYVAAGVFGVLGFVVGGWFDALALVSLKDDSLRLQYDGMLDLVSDLQHRYDE